MRNVLLVLATLASLVAPRVYSSCVTLTWTASGDDGYEGVAYKYEIRYSTSYLTEATWALATPAVLNFNPGPAGQRETFLLGGLEPGRLYYFGVKVVDEKANWSRLSNVVAKVAPADRCVDRVGNADCGVGDLTSVSDLAILINHLFLSGPLCCELEGNIDGDANGKITVGDISMLIDHLFLTMAALPWCS